MKYLAHIFLLFLIVACIKPYEFEAGSYESLLVIDGRITDRPGPYSVKISYTYPLDSSSSQPVNNATVWVEDANGIRTDFTRLENGTYQSPFGFIGQPGNSYQLFVDLDGISYQSREESLIPSPLIDSIYGRYVVLPNEDENVNEGGIQFFVDSKNSAQNTQHFRYEWKDAYQIIVPYPAAFEVLPDSSLVPYPPGEGPGYCYGENFSTRLIYGSTVGTVGNQVREFPVRFVSENEQYLRIKYGLVVQQFAISESAYEFYRRLTENNESGGSLFDKQTGAIFGNISVVETGEPVLGYFEVSGVSESTRFFHRSELNALSRELSVAGFPYTCRPENIVFAPLDSVVYYLAETGGSVFATDFTAMPPVAAIHFKACTECAYYASTTPPDYWID